MQLELTWKRRESNYYNKQTNNKQTEVYSEYKKNKNIKKTKQNTEKKWVGWLVLGFEH